MYKHTYTHRWTVSGWKRAEYAKRLNCSFSSVYFLFCFISSYLPFFWLPSIMILFFRLGQFGFLSLQLAFFSNVQHWTVRIIPFRCCYSFFTFTKYGLKYKARLFSRKNCSSFFFSRMKSWPLNKEAEKKRFIKCVSSGRR